MLTPIFSNPRKRGLILVLACALGAPVSALHAQTVDEQLRAMREEIQRLRQEVDSLREELHQRPPAAAQKEVAAATAAPVQPQAGVAVAPQLSAEQALTPEEAIPLLQAQVAEHAQTKVESNSKLPVRIFGTLLTQAFFNSHDVNWLDNPNVVNVRPMDIAPGSLGLSLRQSRLGAVVDGPRVGPFRARGFVAVDFLGSNLSFQGSDLLGVPRLLYGYVRLEGQKTSLEVGQDQMMLAPRNPTSLAAFAFPELYRSGNLYLYAPQVRVERKVEVGGRSELVAMAGVLAPIGQYGNYSTSEYSPGERAVSPAVQSRVAWRSRPEAPAEATAWEFGLSGHYGRERFLTDRMESWAVASDFDVRRGRLGLGGEMFVGRNLASLGGGVGQSGKAFGGFVEGRVKATSRLGFNTGFGTDRMFDVRSLLQPLGRNSGLFANTIFQFTPELAGSVEYRWISTVPLAGQPRRNGHFDVVVAYSF